MGAVVEKLKNLHDVVEYHLTNDYRMRDDDNLLVATVWYNQTKKKGYDPRHMTSFDFMQLYIKGQIATADAITRVRRKLQEQHPPLRGSKWDERHTEANDVKYNY